MADFEIAWKRTAANEGGYENDPDDRGGETYHGIARNMDKTWGGWKIIDEQKRKPNFPANIKDRRSELDILEKQYYKATYWDTVWGDRIIDQKIANDMYDTAVNLGYGTSVKLQNRQFGFSEKAIMDSQLLDKLNSIG